MTVPFGDFGRVALSLLVPFLVLAAAARVTERWRIRVPAWVDRALAHSWAPHSLGTISALLTCYVWSSLREPGVVHDERAYLLQARIFAAGRWTGEVPPLPSFFEQMHVFVVPHLAAKYPPGHALLLAPGMWLGLPGLMPLLFTAIAGGLLFAILRRASDPIVALLTWALWSTSASCLLWRSSYLSETTSTALWLLSMWAVLRWRDRSKTLDLGIAAAAFAWMYLARPLTALALGAPAAFFVLITAWQRRRLGQLAIAAALAAPILLLNFVWHERTLDRWVTNPYEEYSRVYFPLDKPGFGVDASPPLRALPAEMAALWQPLIDLHAAHRPAALPRIAIERMLFVVLELGEQWRGFLIVLFLLGLCRAGGAARFASLSGLGLLAAYLIFAHPPHWTVYYLEIFPVFFFVAVHELLRSGGTLRRLDPSTRKAVACVALCLMTPWLAMDVVRARERRDRIAGFHRQAEATLASIPDSSAVVFIRYPATHDHNLSLVTNAADWRAERLWLVADRGRENDRLLQLTDRAAYRLDTDTWSLHRLR